MKKGVNFYRKASNPNVIYYKVFDGTSYGSEQSYDYYSSATGKDFHFMKQFNNPYKDEAIVILGNTSGSYILYGFKVTISTGACSGGTRFFSAITGVVAELCVDAFFSIDGKCHVLFPEYVSSAYRLREAIWNGSSWDATATIGDAVFSGSIAPSVGVARKKNDKVAIAFVCDAMAVPNSVSYLRFDGTSWESNFTMMNSTAACSGGVSTCRVKWCDTDNDRGIALIGIEGVSRYVAAVAFSYINSAWTVGAFSVSTINASQYGELVAIPGTNNFLGLGRNVSSYKAQLFKVTMGSGVAAPTFTAATNGLLPYGVAAAVWPARIVAINSTYCGVFYVMDSATTDKNFNFRLYTISSNTVAATATATVATGSSVNLQVVNPVTIDVDSKDMFSGCGDATSGSYLQYLVGYNYAGGAFYSSGDMTLSQRGTTRAGVDAAGVYCTYNQEPYVILTPVLVSPTDNASGSQTQTFQFTLPEVGAPAGGTIKYAVAIEMSTTSNFASIALTKKSWVDSFEYYNGSSWVSFPSTGLDTTHVGRDARISIAIGSEGDKYWRAKVYLM